MRKSTLNRMLELSDIKPIIKESKMKLSNFELVKESVDGNTYVIVRENKKYHIKQAQTKEGLTESDFDYVGGVANKMKKSFSSYSDATKHLNLMFEEINNHYDVESMNLLESDDTLSEKKFVLKLDKKKKPKATPPPIEEPSSEEEFDFGDEEMESDEEPSSEEEFDFGDEEMESDEDIDLEDSEDEIKDIQSTTGKLGQQLRGVEDLSSDMQKWVVKSVLSALDLENMDSSDKKDIIRAVKKKSEKDTEEMDESYDNYMDEGDYMDGMDNYDWGGSKYESYMEDIVGTNNPNDEYSPNRRTWESKEDTELGGDEDDRVAQPDEVGDDMLLLDIEDMGPEEIEALYGTNRRERYGRSDMSKARRIADKDISRHYTKPAAPGYETKSVDKWAKHKLPYDMEFMDENTRISEDHFNDEMDTYEQEKAYEDVETFVRRYGLDVDLRSKETSEDPEETLIYLDIVDGNKKLLVTRINSVGQIEVGEMRGNKFIGEPVDSVTDFIEIFGEDLTNKEKQELDMVEDIEMSPAPQKAPEKDPSEPATKPGKPEKKPGRERPSRRPFTPPPHIKPGEEPSPKAEYDDDVEFE